MIPNGYADIFVRDRQAGTTEKVKFSATGGSVGETCSAPAISLDGTHVAFVTYSGMILLRDLQADTTVVVAGSRSGNPRISGDGSYVVFESNASNLVPGDSGYPWDVFVRDTDTNAITRLSVDGSGVQGNADSRSASISADGRYVAFATLATNLIPGGIANGGQILVYDLVAGSRVVASVTVDGALGNMGSGNLGSGGPSISADGRYVAFESNSTNLAPNDTNDRTDVFVAPTGPVVTGLSSGFGATAGGTTVVVSGAHFTEVSGVSFGGVPASSYTVDSFNRITAVAPAHAVGSVRVEVTASAGTTPDTEADDFTYVVAPTVSGLSVNSGPCEGGTSVVVSGTGFDGVDGPGGVTFGGKNALEYHVDSPSQITALAPFHAAGKTQVSVSYGSVGNVDTTADDFTYVDTGKRIVERVSVSGPGAEGDGHSYHTSMSSDGRYVAFQSDACNLVPGDTNGSSDIFVYDRQSGTIRRVSVSSAGLQGYADSGWASISANGRYVAFSSDSADLDPADSNGGYSDVFVHDTVTGTTTLVSWPISSDRSDYGSFMPSMSADGRFVCYTRMWKWYWSEFATPHSDIYVYDRSTGMTESITDIGTGDDNPYGVISGNGRYVAFETYTPLLFTTDNWAEDVYIFDRQTQAFSLVSRTSTGAQAETGGDSYWPSISYDGRYVAFESLSATMVPGDTNGAEDIFVRDRTSSKTTMVSVSNAGAQGDDSSFFPSVSSDGRYVAYESYATNLVLRRHKPL